MLSKVPSTRHCHDCAVVALGGELDLAGVAPVTAARTAVAARYAVVIADLAALEFIESSGAAALARGRRQVWKSMRVLASSGPCGVSGHRISLPPEPEHPGNPHRSALHRGES